MSSNETVIFIEEVVERVEKTEKVKNENDQFCKQALAQKAKMERAGKKTREVGGQGVRNEQVCSNCFNISSCLRQ